MKTLNRLTQSKTMALLALPMVAVSVAEAAPKKKSPVPRDVQVDNVKEAYWNRTSEGDIEVVQNRQFSKKNRLSLQAFAGTIATDPFLSVKSVGGGLSYHFSESFGITAIGRKYLVSDSRATEDLRTGTSGGGGIVVNVNKPDVFYGGEFVYTPLYGKISLSGSSIVHYDAHLIAGLGVTDTETGKLLTPNVGFGPQFYLSNSLALRLDYRMFVYKETIIERVLNNPAVRSADRTNYSHEIAVGLEVFL